MSTQDDTPLRFEQHLDRLAIALSGACIFHCLALPIVTALLPIFPHSAHNEWVHWAFLAGAIPASIFSLRHIRHSQVLTKTLRTGAAFGLTLLALGALGWPSRDLEMPISVAGGLILAVVHLVNYYSGTLTDHAHKR
jgi:hypothetical protein